MVSGYQWLIETYAQTMRWLNGGGRPPIDINPNDAVRQIFIHNRCVNIQLILSHFIDESFFRDEMNYERSGKLSKMFSGRRRRRSEKLRVGAPIRRERAYRSNLGKWEIHPVAEMSHAYRDTAVLFLWCFRVATMIHEAPGFSGSPTSVTPNRSLDAPYGITRPAI